MPIPTKKPTENKAEFMRRCMKDGVMVRDYPKESQRYAVCSIEASKSNKVKINHK